MENKFLIVANWKSNIPEISNFKFLIPNSIEIAIAPQIPQIPQIPQSFTRCAQDVSQFPPGPYTGEVSAEILKSLNVKYCLVGHSERRKYFGETTETVAKKIDRLRTNDIIPIVCARTFADIVPAEIIMYEPEDAISTNGDYHPANNINEILTDWKTKLPQGTRFLYGGSINPNFKFQILNFKLINGFVVGNASLDPQTFSAIIRQCPR